MIPRGRNEVTALMRYRRKFPVVVLRPATTPTHPRATDALREKRFEHHEVKARDGIVISLSPREITPLRAKRSDHIIELSSNSARAGGARFCRCWTSSLFNCSRTTSRGASVARRRSAGTPGQIRHPVE